MMPHRKAVLANAWVCLALLGIAGNAEAQCTFTSIKSVSGNNGSLGGYSPAGQPQPLVMNMTLVMNVDGTGTCSGALAFQSPVVPARLLHGASSLQYDIKTMSGTSLLYVTQPTATLPISAVAASGQTTVQVAVQVQAVALAGQITPGGAYYASDVSVQLVAAQDRFVARTSAIRTGSIPAATAVRR